MGIALQCAGLVLLATGSASPWDAVEAFRPGTNPSGPWSYGYTVPGQQSFAVYNTAGTTGEGFPCWWADNWSATGGAITRTPDDGPHDVNGFRFVPGWVLLHPGPQDQKATLRFTAPSDCQVFVAVHFGGTHATTSTDVRLVQGATELFSASVRGMTDWEHPARTPQATASCTRLLALRAGETLDVLVGFGGDAYTCDYTAVRLTLTPLDQKLQRVAGVVRSFTGALAGCRVSTSLAGQEIAVQTDAAGAFSLMLPEGSHVVRFTKAQYEPWQREVVVTPDGTVLPPIVLPMAVDHSYTFAPPHRLTVSWPGSSAKTLLDVHADHMRIAWTYHDMTEVAVGAPPLPLADHFVDVFASLDGRSFAEHRWERSPEGLPIVLDQYATDGASLRVEYVGGRDGMIARVTAKNGTLQPHTITMRCLDAAGGQAVDWTNPASNGVALTGVQPGRLQFLTVGASHHLRDSDLAALLWHLEPAETREGFLVRPANAAIDQLPEYRQRDWSTAFDEGVQHWRSMLGNAMRIELPDARMQQAFYACLADLLTMQERAANGKLTQTTGSEVYRFSNAGDCAGGVVGLAMAGLVDNAMEAFDTQFHLAQPDGNWAGGAFGEFVAFSGLKAWVATVFYQLNHDRKFLADLYPYMLNDARWHAAQRAKQRRVDQNGNPIRGYGLIQPTMHDCGMNDAAGTRVFIPHNIWAVYADKVALNVAELLGKEQDAVELAAIYRDASKDLFAAIDTGAIQEEGCRWIPSSPNDPSGSFWGALNVAVPCGLLELTHPLVEGTIAKMESCESEGGLTKFTGWQKEGLWVAVVLDNLGMVYLARGESDKFARQLYAAVNHASLLDTWPEEHNEKPGTTTVTGDRQHIWTSGAFATGLRSALVFERGRTLCIGLGMPRQWLASGKPIRAAGAPTAFGTTSWELCYHHKDSEIRGSVAVPDTCDASELRVYLRLPDTLRLRATQLPNGMHIEEEQPVAADAPKCPVLVVDQPRGTIRLSVPVELVPCHLSRQDGTSR
jgi:hypothetical protein